MKEESLFQFIRRNYPHNSQGRGGHICVDLDKTLAIHDDRHSISTIGDPVPAMQETILDLLNAGYDVKIMIARVGAHDGDNTAFVAAQVELIEAWCQEHLGRVLPITASKDFRMILLLDDRAIRIKANEGVPTLLD